MRNVTKESEVQIPVKKIIFSSNIKKSYYIDTHCAISLWNIVSFIKGGMQVKSIWKQDPEVNIWMQEGWEWRVKMAPQWGIS